MNINDPHDIILLPTISDAEQKRLANSLRKDNIKNPALRKLLDETPQPNPLPVEIDNKKYTPLTKSEYEKVRGMNRHERRKWLKQRARTSCARCAGTTTL
jgi:hypothetical protein